MPRIVIVGGGIVGLSTAMMLAKQGHEVIVLERDGGSMPGSPDEAWQGWDRRGVAQFRQPHYLHPAGRQILDAGLPEVTEALHCFRSADGTDPQFIAGLLTPFDSFSLLTLPGDVVGDCVHFLPRPGPEGAARPGEVAGPGHRVPVARPPA
jgi:hypothetical protein